ncbi:DNA modification methylase, partial [Campylobacter jejuni]|nr:DNA modification methylase [Campylobacter jejuni]EHC3294838.1 DNA modification methylase [Campylobacter jejuni]
MKENPSFLKEQIITYLGNKRALLSFLNNGFKVAK